MPEPNLTLKNIAMRYGRRKLFSGLSAEITAGMRLAITGPNGSGKTTLLRIMSGLERPTAGEAVLQIEGRVVDPMDRALYSGLVGPYLNLYDRFSLKENLGFVARVRGIRAAEERIEEVLREVQLADRGDDLLASYSSGMKQRARWAQALLNRPPILLLDEPFSNLDAAGKSRFTETMEKFTNDGGIIVIATNEPAEAALCTTFLDINDYQGTKSSSRRPS